MRLGSRDTVTKRLIVPCSNYVACPICDRCERNGVFQKCKRCVAGGGPGGRCRHTEQDRAMMIRRDNFGIRVKGKEWLEAFQEAERQAASVHPS